MYRNDHVAARARVRALEIDLDRARRVVDELESATPPVHPTPATPSTMPWALVLIAATAIGGVVTIALANHASHSHRRAETTTIAAPPPTRDAADRVIDDGIARAAELAPGARLVEISAEGILGDGTLDPDDGKLEVEMIRDNGPDPGPTVDPTRPIGAAMPERFYFQYDCIRLVYAQGRWQDHWHISSTIERLHSCFDTFDRKPPVARTCSLPQVLARVRADVPATALARVVLDLTGWTYTIDDPRLRVYRRLDDDCTGPPM